jgi:hypothetical protein
MREHEAMKIYRIAFECPVEGQQGFAFTSSLSEARKQGNEWVRENKLAAIEREANVITRTGNPESASFEIETISFKPTKDGILKVLNRYASHFENG